MTTEDHWSRDPALNRFAAGAFILLGVVGAIVAFLDHRWFGLAGNILLTAGIIDFYIVAHRADKRRLNERSPSMVTCEKCGESYADAVRFCPRDGTPLGATAAAMDRTPRTCSRCGAKSEGLKFCPKDGTLLEPAS